MIITQLENNMHWISEIFPLRHITLITTIT